MSAAELWNETMAVGVPAVIRINSSETKRSMEGEQKHLQGVRSHVQGYVYGQCRLLKDE